MGDVFKAITPATTDSHRGRATVTIVLALATLDIATKNRNDPIWVTQPGQVIKAISCRNIAGIIMYKHR
jgi:hypothetical protein